MSIYSDLKLISQDMFEDLVMSRQRQSPRIHRAWPLFAILLGHIVIDYFELNNIDICLIFIMWVIALLFWFKIFSKGIFAITEEE